MDLYSNATYWQLKNGLITTYPSLKANIETDIAILGAGISGALTGYYLSKTSFNFTILDRRHAAMGSTAASTSLLQYEIDTPLHRLRHYVGEADAVASYKISLDAIFKLKDICHAVGHDITMKPSLQYASYKTHVSELRNEYMIRKQNGFHTKWLDGKMLYDLYHFEAPAGIINKIAAETDVYRLTHKLLKHCSLQGRDIFDNTNVIHIEYGKNQVTLYTEDGYTVKAKKLIIATGYESVKYIPKKVANLHSTYAIVSEPMLFTNFWYKNSLIWETATPYLYFRTTDDNRILIGGKDDIFYNPKKRDDKVSIKKKQLQTTFNKKFPHLNIKADFAWAGTFATTKDGLPYIGTIKERPNTFFALGFGGNGITFCAIAAEIIHDLLLGKSNNAYRLFSFNR